MNNEQIEEICKTGPAFVILHNGTELTKCFVTEDFTLTERPVGTPLYTLGSNIIFPSKIRTVSAKAKAIMIPNINMKQIKFIMEMERAMWGDLTFRFIHNGKVIQDLFLISYTKPIETDGHLLIPECSFQGI